MYNNNNRNPPNNPNYSNNNSNSNNPNDIKKTLNDARHITNAANTYLSSINPNPNESPENPPSSQQAKEAKSYLLHTIAEKNKNNPNNKNDSDSDMSIEENNYQEDSDDEGIYTLEYLSNHIDRYSKKVEKYDAEVKKNLQLSKKYPNKKEEYKDEAVRALKKKKFYGKCLERTEKRKLKLDLKNLDKEFEAQKKELKKLTHDFKKKVALVTRGEEINEEGVESGDDVNEVLEEVDMDDKTLNEEYLRIICRPEVMQANENLNLFKFIFQEDQ